MEAARCLKCGFELWRPIASIHSSHLGLYSDARFPGRSILSLREHSEHFDLIDHDTLWNFMTDIQSSVTAIKHATKAPRVNVAVLGNQEGHVHAHLIPRKPVEEPNPDKAPWEDGRQKGPLPADEEERLMKLIANEFPRSTRFPTPSAAELMRKRLERLSLRARSTATPLFDLLADDKTGEIEMQIANNEKGGVDEATDEALRLLYGKPSTGR
jgi:diadenosine tetraphosphate (Ap4A) HIT family hydrolase